MTHRKFFIVGCPRSGTTLLQQCLNRHSQIAIPPETAFFSLLGLSRSKQGPHVARINADLDINLRLPKHRVHRADEAALLFEELTNQYMERLRKPGVACFGEKTPEHLNRIDRIAKVFPDAKIIVISRDGRDVALSLRQLPWTSRDLYVNFALWLYCCRLEARARNLCNLGKLFLRYEDLVVDPRREFRRILDFLELPYEAEVAEGGGNATGLPAWEAQWKGRASRAIGADRVGLWRETLTTHEVGILERWGGDELRSRGYNMITNCRERMPWLFYPQVALRSIYWLATRPVYADHRVLWEKGRTDGESLLGSKRFKKC